jgi:hypothetical protein
LKSIFPAEAIFCCVKNWLNLPVCGIDLQIPQIRALVSFASYRIAVFARAAALAAESRFSRLFCGNSFVLSKDIRQKIPKTMERIFSFIFSFLLTVSAHSQIRIEKRHYNRGWYISLNNPKKEASARPQNFTIAAESPAPVAEFEKNEPAPAVIADSIVKSVVQPVVAPFRPQIANSVR